MGTADASAMCDSPVSVTTGTIFDKTRTPLVAWFAAAWAGAQQATGVSVNGLHKEVSAGSPLHSLRVAGGGRAEDHRLQPRDSAFGA